MSDMFAELVSTIDAQGMIERVKGTSAAWLKTNRTDLKVLGTGSGEAILVIAIVKAFPSVVSNPEINIKKMQASALLLKLAAKNKTKIDKLQASADAAMQSMLKDIFNKLVSVTIKAALAAALV